MNNTSNQYNISCQKSRYLNFLLIITKNNKNDILALQIFYIITSIVTVITNLVPLLKLWKKIIKSRPDKLFIIMSISDVCVGLFSIPMATLCLFIKDKELLCKFSPVILFFAYTFPYTFSWLMIIIISLDRVFMITKRYIYSRYITIKVLYGIIILSMIIIIVSGIYGNITNVKSFRPTLFRPVIEIVTIAITIIAYLYFFYYIRSRLKRISKKSRHCRFN